MPSKHFRLIFSFDNKQDDRAERQGQAEVGDARRILSEMRDVQKSILRLGPSPGDAEHQQHPHYKSKQLSAFSLQLWHYGSFGGFISIRAHLHPEWQSSILPGALQRKGCSYIDNKQEEKNGICYDGRWIFFKFWLTSRCILLFFFHIHLILIHGNSFQKLPPGWTIGN